MSDNKFINTYIETCVNTLQENLNNTLQLKTQLKVANDLIVEKDSAIGNLLRELEDKKNVEAQYHNAMESNRAINDELLGLRNKVTHLDTALRQVAEMKTMLLLKDKEIESLKPKEVDVEPAPVKRKRKEVIEMPVSTDSMVNDF